MPVIYNLPDPEPRLGETLGCVVIEDQGQSVLYRYRGVIWWRLGQFPTPEWPIHRVSVVVVPPVCHVTMVGLDSAREFIVMRITEDNIHETRNPLAN
jgi:hypothetical protein